MTMVAPAAARVRLAPARQMIALRSIGSSLVRICVDGPRVQADWTGADALERPPMTATVAVKLLSVMNEAAIARRLLRSIVCLRVFEPGEIAPADPDYRRAAATS